MYYWLFNQHFVLLPQIKNRMKSKLNLLALTTLFFMLVAPVYAQKSSKTEKSTTTSKKSDKKCNDAVDSKKFLKDWFITIHGGGTSPFTDIRSYDWARQTKKPSELQWGAGVGMTKMINNAFGFNVDYTLGKISGRTLERGGFAEGRSYWKQLFPERTAEDGPVYFKTSIFHQVTLNLYVDWLSLGTNINKYIRSEVSGKPMKVRRVALYSKVGVGLIRLSSQIYNSKDDKPITNNQYLRGFTNKFTEVVFPMTMGLKFRVNSLFDIGTEGTFVFTNSDKLDAFNFVSRIDPNTGTTINSRSKLTRDAYAYFNINFNFKFGRIGSQKQHVEWVDPLAYVYNKIPDLKDTDNDGVLDILDKEPKTLEGYMVDSHGITLDSDKDGCPDSKDAEPFSSPNYPIKDCKNVIPPPAVAEVADSKKTPPFDPEALIKRIQKVEDNLWKLTSVYFAIDKSTITPTATAELKRIGLLMTTNPDLKVNVKGSCDSRASDEYNQKLSEKRVDAAIQYLNKNYNISADRFIKLPMGKSDQLVKDASTEELHNANRRVDFYPAK